MARRRLKRRIPIVIRLTALLLPRNCGRIMLESWTADIEFAGELRVKESEIAMGAVLFVVKRGPSLWLRLRATRVSIISASGFATLLLTPSWLLPIACIAGVVLWLSFTTQQTRRPPR